MYGIIYARCKLHRLCYWIADDPGYGLNESWINICCLNADAVFLILYKELYYRHIYAKVSVSTLEFILLCYGLHLVFNLHSAFHFYINILCSFRVARHSIRDLNPTTIIATSSTTFSVSPRPMLVKVCVRSIFKERNPSNIDLYWSDADGPAPLELPNQWLWDIIDEFIYQVSLKMNWFTLRTPSHVSSLLRPQTESRFFPCFHMTKTSLLGIQQWFSKWGPGNPRGPFFSPSLMDVTIFNVLYLGVQEPMSTQS